jgi:acyl transferase domain-containing protein/pimeloyl-ACP methyl ester carboxylesterase
MTRTHFEQRAVVIAQERAALLASLQALAAGEPSAHAVMGRARSGEGKLAVLFTGQGSQRPQMGKGLYARFAVFREALDGVFSAFERELVRSLRDVMFAEEHSEEAALLDQTEFAQPALFALEVALYRLLSSWGVRPDMLVGHSIGEISAAHVAGVMSLADASKLVAARGRLMQGLPAGGAMLALSASEAELMPLLEHYAGCIDVAAVNGSQAVVVSGDEDAVLAVGRHFEAQGRRVSRLRVSHAFHSGRMEEMLEPFGRVVRDLQLRPPTVPIISNVTGMLATADELTTAEYWVLHARRTVRFYQAVQTLEQAGIERFVELGPQGVLSALVQEGLSEGAQERAGLWAALRKGQDEVSSTLTALGGLYAHGQPVEWSAFFGPLGAHTVPLPTYAFERQRYWLEAGGIAPGEIVSPHRVHRNIGGHPLLGNRIHAGVAETIFEATIESGSALEHRAFGESLFPLTALAEILLAAARQLAEPLSIEALTVHQSLVPSVPHVVQTIVSPAKEGRRTVRVVSRTIEEPEVPWSLRATAILIYTGAPPRDSVDRTELIRRCSTELSGQAFYAELEASGLDIGSHCRSLKRVWVGTSEAVGEIASATASHPYVFDPALLDGAIQLFAATLSEDERKTNSTYLVTELRELSVWRAPGESVLAHAVRTSGATTRGVNCVEVDVSIYDLDGSLLGRALGTCVRQAKKERVADTMSSTELLYNVAFRPEADLSLKPLPLAQEVMQPVTWLLIGESSVLVQSLSGRLAKGGSVCVFLSHGALFAEQAPLQFTTNFDHAEIVRTLDTIRDRNLPPLQGIIYLGSEVRRLTDATTAAELGRACMRDGIAVLHTLQVLASRKWSSPPPRLWIITREAQAVRDCDPVAIESAPLWGLGRVAAHEHSELWGGLIDLGPAEEHDAVSIASTVLTVTDEREIAFRRDTRYVARLVRLQHVIVPAVPIVFHGDATYLITGGLGGIGLRIAQWMMECGSRHLVLVGRTSLSEEARSVVREIEMAGARIDIRLLDVADEASVRTVIREFAPKLRGIMHAAGTLDDAIICNQDWPRFERVFRPKIQGAWNLHVSTLDLALDHFVLFGSAASVLGAPGQANYAAANAFLDALARHRREGGRSAVCVNWGTWSNVGMAKTISEVRANQWGAAGHRSIAPHVALDVLDAAMQCDLARVTAISMNWTKVRTLLGSRAVPALLRELLATGSEPIGEVTLAPSIELLVAMTRRQRQDAIAEHVRELVAQVLGERAQTIERSANVLHLGMDSLMAMEVLKGLKRSLGIMLYPRELYERPQLDLLTEYLVVEFERMHAGRDRTPEPLPLIDGVSPVEIISRPTVSEGPILRKTLGPTFILCSPRSGSTLLRVMLAGHPGLFSPPELHLLPFQGMKERLERLGSSYLTEGLQRALMELAGLDAAESKREVERLEKEDVSVQSVYELLQEKSAPRKLIDKSPTYASDFGALQRAEMLFEGAKYIHLVRHPYPVIESFVRMRFDKLLGQSDLDPYRLAERVWVRSNANTLQFLRSVSDDRKLSIRYEQLVRYPEETMRRVCQFLGLPFDPAVLRPYEGLRMTDGVTNLSAPLGDVNFHNHREIEADLADAWRTIRLPTRLSSEMIALASSFEYELPDDLAAEPSRFQCVTPATPLMQEEMVEVRGLATCWCVWGPCDAPAVLIMHGFLDHGAAWDAVARPLAARGYRVVAPDLRGHGRSAHISPSASYNFMDFLADLVAIGSRFASPFTLVGHSMGAAMAAAYAAAYPERVQSLILIEPPLPASESGSSIDRLRVHLDALSNRAPHIIFPNEVAAAQALRRSNPRLTPYQARVMAARLTVPYPGGVRWCWDARLRTRAGIGYSGSGGFAGGSYAEMLQGINSPMTLVYGNNSESLRKSDVDRFVQVANGARTIWLDGGHNLHHDAPDALASIIDQHGWVR